MRIRHGFLGAVTGGTTGAILGGVGFYLRDVMGPDRYLLFGPSSWLSILLGVLVMGLLGGVTGLIVGVALLKKPAGAVVGLFLGIGAVVWQRHNVASAGLPPLEDTIIVSTELLGLPLIGTLVATVIERARSNRSKQVRAR